MDAFAPSDVKQLIDTLQTVPMLDDVKGRQAMMLSAGLAALLPTVDLTGPSAITLPLLVSSLARFGFVDDDHHALGLFLLGVKGFVGVDRQAYLDEIIGRYKLVREPETTSGVTVTAPTVTQVTPPRNVKDPATLRPVAYLELGAASARAVALVQAHLAGDRYVATGFLLDDSLLMTINRILPTAADVATLACRFNYQIGPDGVERPFKEYPALPDGIYHVNDALEYVIVELDGAPGKEFGWLTLTGQIPTKGDRVNIIQHPMGQPKQVSVYNNNVEYADANVIQYITTTFGGTSGAPVFDDNWRVVALHHAAAFREPGTDIEVRRNEGIAVAAILADLPPDIRARLTVVEG